MLARSLALSLLMFAAQSWASTVHVSVDGGAVKVFDMAGMSVAPDGTTSLDVTTPGKIYRTLTFRVNPAPGVVSFSVAGQQRVQSGVYLYKFENGTQVTLTAEAGSGYGNPTWEGCTQGDAPNQCTVTLNADATITASFTPSYLLTVSKTGTGTVSSSPAGISCGADCSETYESGTGVTLTAAAGTGNVFTGWSGGGCSGTGSCVVAMDAGKAVTANFTPTYALTVTKGGTGTGTVTSSPAGISCGSDCNETYNSGTSVTLTAAATTGSAFAGWSGACTGTGTCTVSMSAARAVTATFNTVPTYTLTVSKAGTGSGTVTSTPSGISCGSDCSEVYSSGTSVTLAASATTGSTFAGWSGGGCSGTGACTVSVSAATTVTATFNTVPTYTLTVTKAGSGSGTVTSNPSGISCGSDCTEVYSSGTSVTLSASATTGSTFGGWSGGGCTGTGTCTVNIAAATTVTATFTSTADANCPNIPSNGVCVVTGVSATAFPQTSYNPTPSQVYAFKFRTPSTATAASYVGVGTTVYIPPATAGKLLVISSSPADVSTSGKSLGCYKYNVSSSLTYVVNRPDLDTIFYCHLQPDTVYYFNAASVDLSGNATCTTTSNCAFKFEAR